MSDLTQLGFLPLLFHPQRILIIFLVLYILRFQKSPFVIKIFKAFSTQTPKCSVLFPVKFASRYQTRQQEQDQMPNLHAQLQNVCKLQFWQHHACKIPGHVPTICIYITVPHNWELQSNLQFVLKLRLTNLTAKKFQIKLQCHLGL